ncbi:MAG: hypothetical protein GTO54_12580 [Nitrososphaeria archaeon]|nr:hypothetical protein [Nitrososphaeria archaeon]
MFLFIGFVIGLFAGSIVYPCQGEGTPLTHTRDYREFSSTMFIVNITWIRQPLADVMVHLLDRDLEVLKTSQTNSSGLVVIDARDLPYDEYYIFLERPMKFEEGGVEIFRKWFVVKTSDIRETLTINLETAPKIWPNKPDIMVDD